MFQLNRQMFSNRNRVVVTNLERERQATLVCHGLGGKYSNFDLLEALKSGLFELVEQSKDDVIPIESSGPARLGPVNIASKLSPPWYQQHLSLEIDTTDELWKRVLRPRATYELRVSRTKGELWAYYDDEPRRPPEEIPLSERLSVIRGDGRISFTVFDDPMPAKLFAKLDVMPKKCHRSGDPPFKIILEISSDSDKAITIDKSDSPFSSWPFILSSVSELIHCEDIETKEAVDWGTAFGCTDDSRYSLPEDTEFVEILPDKPWGYEYLLEKAGSSMTGDIGDLELGRTYEAQAPKNIDWSFSRWMFGSKEDTLGGSLEEKKRRWESDFDRIRTPQLRAYPHGEPVEFKVVD